jgi:hypothetical protein
MIGDVRGWRVWATAPKGGACSTFDDHGFLRRRIQRI